MSMSKKIAEKAIIQGKEIGIEIVSFTGGEPFTNFEVMLYAIKLAITNGIKAEDVATNGGWWKDSKDLSVKMNLLKETGFVGPIHLSIDAFHEVAPTKLAEFIKAVVSVFGKNDIIMISSRETPEIKVQPKLEEIALLLGGSFKRKDVHRGKIESSFGEIFCWVEDVCYIGRASALGAGNHNEWFTEAPCGKMNRTVMINPYGDVEVCVGYISNKNKDMVIGNINENTLKEIVENIASNPIVNSILENRGPQGLKKVLEEYDPSIVPYPFLNPCEFCNFVLNDKKARQTLQKIGYLKD